MARPLSAAFALCAMITPAGALPVERCVNLGTALEAPREGDWGYVIQRDHLIAIANAGFDTIRLPVRFDTHWDGATVDTALMERVDEVIDWARDAGLQVILDLHHYEALMADPDAHAPTFQAIWAFLARYYRGAPDDLIFELLNEPEGVLTTARVTPLYEAAVKRIRKHHPNRWIITGGGNWNALEEMLALPPPGPFEARTFHYYAPWEFTHQGAPWIDDAPLPNALTPEGLAAIETDFAQLRDAPYPILLGEFGVIDRAPSEDAITWTKTVRRAAEANGVGWCAWSFTSPEDNFRIWDQTRDDWRPGYPELLIPQ